MDAPWGIGGWQFLGLYSIALSLAVALVILVVVGKQRSVDKLPADVQRLGHWELALLAGGPSRVEEVAIGVLVATGRVRVDHHGVLRQQPGAQAADPVEQWALWAIGHGHRLHGRKADGSGSLGFATTSLRRDLAADLARRGHLLLGGRETPGYNAHWLVGALVVVGTARLITELDWQWRVELTLMALTVAAAAWGALVAMLRTRAPRPTERGERGVAAVRDRVRRVPDLWAESAWLPAAIAVDGFPAYPDLAVAEVLVVNTRHI
ncbi:TIGR04222 domain-containing membrane protein [Actinokineospora pegani]|uniref:TIGR04222 domain-containing membrane protein n=1 Tax=Actinokineospora pegani TaxID=2654637 RepID=UPI0018D32F1D|nr:TIGR04222 domain-containing membrane protein [Actinokineospora pegani]